MLAPTIGDVDRDGITDFAAGVEYDDALGGTDAGSVVLFSGATGAKLRKLSDPGGAAYDHLGIVRGREAECRAYYSQGQHA